MKFKYLIANKPNTVEVNSVSSSSSTDKSVPLCEANSFQLPSLLLLGMGGGSLQSASLTTTDPPDGLKVIPEFLSKALEQYLLQQIDSCDTHKNITTTNNSNLTGPSKLGCTGWRQDNVIRRRVQHYGYIYNYQHKTITRKGYLGLLPKFLAPLLKKVHLVTPNILDQITINEYPPGIGIAAHIDTPESIDDFLIVVSLKRFLFELLLFFNNFSY